MDREEILRSARNLYENPGTNEALKVVLEETYPELKESEDERIRKAIEGTIRVYGKTQGEWLCGYDMDTLVVHLREAFGALERQKEPLTPEENMNHPLYLEGFDVGKKVGEVLKEQKPAEWSDGDEDMLKSIIATCQLAAQDRDSGPAWKLCEMQERFLKSIPERFNPQPHWKPSEEQMKEWSSESNTAQGVKMGLSLVLDKINSL